MRILHVLTAPRAEGTPRLALDWLDIPGVEQHVFFLNETPDTLLNEFQKKASSVIINQNPLRGKGKFFVIAKEAYKICKLLHPVVVVVYPTGISQYVQIGAKLAGVKRLITHAGNPPSAKGLFSRYLASYLTFWPSFFMNVKVIACSDYVKSSFQNIKGVPSSIFYGVHNSFHPERFISEKTGIKQKAVMVATMEAHKDHQTLLRAWRLVEKRNENVFLDLVGDGSLKKPLEILSNDLGLQRVNFLGYKDNIPQVLKSSDVFIFSTTPSEGFGTVLLEALAAGLSVVATDVPACREVLKGEEFGKLTPPKDHESLAETIIYAFTEPLSRTRIEKQQKFVSSFTPERMMKSYLEIAGIKEEELPEVLKSVLPLIPKCESDVTPSP